MPRRYHLLTHKTQFTFELRACQEAVMQISDGKDYTHEIVFGAENNAKIILRQIQGGSDLDEVSTPSLLDCVNKKKLWVDVSTSYKNNMLMFDVYNFNCMILLIYCVGLYNVANVYIWV